MKLLNIPRSNPFACCLFEVKEFPENKDLFIFNREDLDNFLTEVMNPYADSPLLGIEVAEENIEYIELYCLPGVQRLNREEA